MRSHAIIFLLGIMSLVGCQAVANHNSQPITSNAATLKTTIGGLNIGNPEVDVDKNTGNNDFRFICICGLTCYAPGVEKDDLTLTKKYGVRCLEGTSDAIESDEHEKLIQTARIYAEAYNMLLLKKLKITTAP